MRDILLVLVLILIAVLGEILVKHIDAFMDKNYKGYTPADPKEDRIYVRFSDGKNSAEISEEIEKLQEANMQCTIILCKDSDAEIIDYLRQEGRAVNFK